jgi:hypothetical protein
MANIDISDLRPAGADLFLDSESYLNDLTEGEVMNTLGGGKRGSLISCSFIACCNLRPQKEAKRAENCLKLKRA